MFYGHSVFLRSSWHSKCKGCLTFNSSDCMSKSSNVRDAGHQSMGNLKFCRPFGNNTTSCLAKSTIIIYKLSTTPSKRKKKKNEKQEVPKKRNQKNEVKQENMDYCGQMMVKHLNKGPPILAAFQKKPRNLSDKHILVIRANCNH